MTNVTDTTKPASTDADKTPTTPLPLTVSRNSAEAREQLDKAFEDLQQTSKTLTVIFKDHGQDVDISEAVTAGKAAKDYWGELDAKERITVKELAKLSAMVIDAMQLTTTLAIASRQYTDEQVHGLREETQGTFLVFSERVEDEFVKVHRRLNWLEKTPPRVWWISAAIGLGVGLIYLFFIAHLMNHDETEVMHITSSLIAGIGGFGLGCILLPRGPQEADEPKSVKLEQVTGTSTTQTALDATAGSHTPAVSKSADSHD